MTQPTANNDTNFTRLLKNEQLQFDSITCGTIEIMNTTISNLNYPVNGTDAATKQYVLDQSSPYFISPIERSIQFNNGINGFASSINLTWSTSSTLSIVDTFNVNGITLSNQAITGVSNYYTNDSAVNKSYIPQITYSSLTNAANNTQLTFSQIYNNLLFRTCTATGIVQDILPDSSTITDELNSLLIYPSSVSNSASTSASFAFDFTYKFNGTGSSMLLFSGTGNTFFPKGNFLNYYGPVEVLTVPINTIVSFKCIGASTSFTFCITNLQTLYSNSGQQITDVGVRTDNFFSTFTGTKSSFIIYPLVKTDIVSNSAHEYTFSELKGLFVTRAMENDVTDTFEDATTIITNLEFALGYGSSKFVLQNISDFSLTLDIVSSTGWAVSPASNPVIPSGKNGVFYINYDTTCTLFVIGIYDR
jgi:hypothetical protein